MGVRYRAYLLLNYGFFAVLRLVVQPIELPLKIVHKPNKCMGCLLMSCAVKEPAVQWHYLFGQMTWPKALKGTQVLHVSRRCRV